MKKVASPQVIPKSSPMRTENVCTFAPTKCTMRKGLLANMIISTFNSYFCKFLVQDWKTEPKIIRIKTNSWIILNTIITTLLNTNYLKRRNLTKPWIVVDTSFFESSTFTFHSTKKDRRNFSLLFMSFLRQCLFINNVQTKKNERHQKSFRGITFVT